MIRIIQENPEQVDLSNFKNIKLYRLNNVLQIRATKNKAKGNKGVITRLSKDLYRNNLTGEVLEYKKRSLTDDKVKDRWRAKFENLYRLVNFNFLGNHQELYITLTYHQPVNFEQTGKDFKGFINRLLYHYPDCEYIAIPEPHATGAGWHVHLLLKNKQLKAFFIPHQEIFKLWRNGSVDVRRISNSDNLGRYCIASIPYSNDLLIDSKPKHKGSLLFLYPKGCRFPWKSKGILTPEPQILSGAQASKLLENKKPDYSSVTSVLQVEENGQQFVLNVIVKQDYTLPKKSSKA